MAKNPLLLFAALWCLSGCEYGPDQQLVGAWSANRLLTKVPKFAAADGMRRLRNGIYATQLKLSADHTFILTGLRQVGGQWSYSKGVLNLDPTSDANSNRRGISDQFRHLHVDPQIDRMSITIPLPFGPIEIVLDKTA